MILEYRNSTKIMMYMKKNMMDVLITKMLMNTTMMSLMIKMKMMIMEVPQDLLLNDWGDNDMNKHADQNVDDYGNDDDDDDEDDDDDDNCSAQTVTRIGLLEEIPRSGVQIPCLS
jgi:hypothetical protein